jgi:hypothetical protein
MCSASAIHPNDRHYATLRITLDKLLFLNRPNGEVVIANASVNAIKNAQKAFSGTAEATGFKNDEDVVDEIMRMRYGEGNE